MDNKLQWAITRIMDTIKPSFYGKITLSFQSGKLCDIKTESNEKPPVDLK